MTKILIDLSHPGMERVGILVNRPSSVSTLTIIEDEVYDDGCLFPARSVSVVGKESLIVLRDALKEADLGDD